MTDTQPAGTPAFDRKPSKYRSRRPDWSVAPEPYPADTPEPSTPPAQPAHTARAAAGGHPGTLDGPGVLGRAWLHQTSGGQPNAWVERDGWWHSHIASIVRTRDEVERERGGREVLLVDPAAWERRERLADASQRWRDVPPDGDEELMAEREAVAADLIDAVDALDRPTTGGESDGGEELPGMWERADFEGGQTDAEPAPEPAGGNGPILVAAPGGGTWHPIDSPEGQAILNGEIVAVRPADTTSPDKLVAPVDATPEPAGDGPGWDRQAIHELIRLARSDALSDDPAASREDLAQQAEALLADRDRLEARDQAAAYHPHSGQQQVRELVGERDTARAELAEVTADRDRYRLRLEHLTTHAKERADEHRAELATARRDAAAHCPGCDCPDPEPTGKPTRKLVLDADRPVPGSPQPAPDGGEKGAQ